MANINHRVIIACRSQIVSELQKGDLNSLADGFYQNGMIAPPERGDIQSEKKQDEKARRLTDVLDNRVHHYPHYYQQFIEMLAERSSQFYGLTVILKNKMSELKLEGLFIRMLTLLMPMQIETARLTLLWLSRSLAFPSCHGHSYNYSNFTFHICSSSWSIYRIAGYFRGVYISRISQKHSNPQKERQLMWEEVWFSISIREITFREQELNWLFAKYKRLGNNPLYGKCFLCLGAHAKRGIVVYR